MPSKKNANAGHVKKVKSLFLEHEKLIKRKNKPLKESNGVYQRYQFPVVTNKHTPVFWRYDLNPETNPFLMERIGVNAAFNSGAMEWKGNVFFIILTKMFPNWSI